MTATITQAQIRTSHARANEVRIAMAAARRPLRERDGLTRAAAMLEDPDEIVARMRVSYLLLGIRGVRERAAVRLIHAAGLPTSILTRRIGPFEVPAGDGADRTLSDRQRAALAGALRAAAERVA